jgi:hypothetical protein
MNIEQLREAAAVYWGVVAEVRVRLRPIKVP